MDLRRGRRADERRAEMPLADGEGRIAVVAQDLTHRRGVRRDVAPHVRIAGRKVRDRPHPHRVVVASGEERGPSRRTKSGGMELAVSQGNAGELLRSLPQ